MVIEINQLNEKYKAEDGNWDFSLFPAWLEKKGIPNTPDMPIVATTLQQILTEFTFETLPEKHHDFDNIVLKRAFENKKQMNNALLEVLEAIAKDSLKKYDQEWYSKGKLSKIWHVIRGKD